ncbi:MAG: FtsX-like permease family protein, partial [Bacteroidota bacterium]
HLSFDLLISTNKWRFLRRTNYISIAAYTYLLLKPGSSPEAITNKFPAVITQYADEAFRHHYDAGYSELSKKGKGYRFYLQALSDIHLHSNLEYELQPNGSILRVKVFGLIALFILLIACINFINLAVARADERAREAGIRKTLGSDKTQLMGQFFVEASMISLISTALALLLAFLLAPYFSLLDGGALFDTPLFAGPNLPLLFLASLLLGLLSGIYPALLFARMQPVQILDRQLQSSAGHRLLRKGLVVFQFAISAVLIIGTLVINNQLQYISQRPLGFNKDFLINLSPGQFLNPTQHRSFQQELAKLNSVTAVGGSNSIPGEETYGLRFRAKNEQRAEVVGRGLTIDKGFVETMQIELLDGRNFAEGFADSLSVLLSESAAQALCQGNCIGIQLTSKSVFMNDKQDEPTPYAVVGVVKDIHFQSLHQKLFPTFFIHHSRFRRAPNYVNLRIKADRVPETIESIQQRWKQFLPNRPFAYHFMDQHLEKLYHNEVEFQQQFTWFSILAILLACIGLWGLAAYTIHRRSKEFSVRRIVGASTMHLLVLLWKEYALLITIAMVLAVPVAWYSMNAWLANFAYASSIKWWMFLLAGLLTVLFALLTVSYHSIKTAYINPVHTLRNE